MTISTERRLTVYRQNMRAMRAAQIKMRRVHPDRPGPIYTLVWQALDFIQGTNVVVVENGVQVFRRIPHTRATQILNDMWIRRYNDIASGAYMDAAADGQRECDCRACGRTIVNSMKLEDQDYPGTYRCVMCVSGDDGYEIDLYNGNFGRYENEDDDDYRSNLGRRGGDPIAAIGKPFLTATGENPDHVGEGTRLFGCEVEFVAPSVGALREIVREQSTNAVGIFKEDGSVPYPGGEYCTIPMTRRGAAEHLKPALDYMVQAGARAWNRSSCGLHIHVSRSSASWLTWGKVERFFNSSDNGSFLTGVAGRDANNYCQRAYSPPMEIPLKAARGKAMERRDRYVALNFTSHHPTVEFRLFRGNVAYRGVMRAIEFCDAILEFAAAQSNQSEMSHQDFVRWLTPRARAYPNLSRYVVPRKKRGSQAPPEPTLEDAA